MYIARVLYGGTEVYAEYREGKYFVIGGDIFGDFSVSDKVISPEKILPPVQPKKIIALGANYMKHAKELDLKVNDSPIIFMKPASAVIGHGDSIVYPLEAAKVDYEAELAIVIKKRCRRVKKEDAFSVILGYTCANDVSERVFQKMDGQWTRAKGYDTFCPLGPHVATDINSESLDLETIVNGVVRQKGNTADMINKVDDIIAFVTQVMTLETGDVILTGTPENIGEIKPGDLVEIKIEKIGSLVNKVVKEI